MYNTKLNVGSFNEKLRRDDVFKTTIGNESLHQDSNNKGVRMVNFCTTKNLVVRSMMFPYQNFHK
jgi:hypothetical protein